MKRLKVFLGSILVIAAAGVAAAGGASAGIGNASIGGPPCDLTFANTGGPTDPTPNSITVNNVVEDPLDPDCAGLTIQNPATSLVINFAGNGTLSGSGLVRIRADRAGLTCFYDSTSFTGTNTATTAIITGAFTRSGGSFLCPVSIPNGVVNVLSF
ncbi:MAG TPA: hypothetical protein VMF31_03870 [Solirubrobacterales bacterium]|nr:hypothetical protein [Solirubrobacterales bacterium]